MVWPHRFHSCGAGHTDIIDIIGVVCATQISFVWCGPHEYHLRGVGHTNLIRYDLSGVGHTDIMCVALTT